MPVLAVSAVDSRDQALAAGAEAFLVKPLDPLQFVSTVRDLLGTSAYLRSEERAMTARLSSGSDRLDAVLGGGLPRNGIVLIGGNPGSGKTILAQQYVFHNARPTGPRCTCPRCPNRWRRSCATASRWTSSTPRHSAQV